MTRHATRRKVAVTAAAAALAAAILPTLPTRAATTLTWDADLTQPGAQGGPGIWTDAGPGWFDGAANINWNNANFDSALFTGTTAGAVTISGNAVAKYLTFDVPGYTLAGGTLALGGGSNIDSGVHANADVTINADLRTTQSDGWIKDGPGTLTLGGNNFVVTPPLHLKSGAIAVENKSNVPWTVIFDGDMTSRLRFTAPSHADFGATIYATTFATLDVQNADVRIAQVGQIRGAGSLIKDGPGTLAPSYPNSLFTGTVNIRAGTLELRDALSVNARPISLAAGTLSLQASTATDFASPVTSRLGTGKTATLAVGGAATNAASAHSLPSLTLISGTLNLTSTGLWGLTVGTLTNGDTIDLNNTRLTVTTALAPFSNSPGTIRFAHATPGTAGPGVTNGLWLATATKTTPGNTTVTSTFAGQTEDADLIVGAKGSGTNATNLTLDGSWRGGGASATSTLVLPRHGNITFGPNFRFNNIPADPAAAPRPVRLWGSGSTPGGKLTFDPAFVADHTNNGATPDGLASIDLSNVTWETNSSQSLPAVTRTLPGGTGTYRAGLITFDNFSNASGYTNWTVKTNDQTYDGGVYVKQAGSIFLGRNLTLTGRVTPCADNQLRVAANRGLYVGGAGHTLTLSGDLGFAPGSRLDAGTATVVFNTDPGAGWYDGNYTRDAAAGTVNPPPAPAHTLKLSLGDNEGHGGAIFNAPVARLAELTVAGTAVASLGLPGPQKVLSVASRLSFFSSTRRTYYLDLTDNALILGAGQYHTPDTVRAMLLGNNLRSTAADDHHALGYARAADVLTPSPSGAYSFLTLPVSAGDVLVRYTILGDATLDGLVNFDDLLALAKHYNATADAHWSAGDFNYDDAVNFDDLLLLAKHYNTALPTAPLPGAPASFAADLAAAIHIAQVPEPSTATSLAIAACGFALSARRRRPTPP